MTRTRGQGSAGGQDGNNNPPPPPPPSATKFLAQFLGNQCAMEEMLRNIAQNTARRGHQRQGLELNQYSTFKDFLDMKPPIFKEAEEPLQANEWLNTIE